jgi:hypothetical protein
LPPSQTTRERERDENTSIKKVLKWKEMDGWWKKVIFIKFTYKEEEG